MKKAVIVFSVVCLILGASIKSHAQYSECYASSQYYGQCAVYSGSSSESPNSAGGWTLYAPTGNLSYSMSVYSNSNGNNQAIIWGDGPNENIYSYWPHVGDSKSGSMSVSSTVGLNIDVEVWANNGSASITVNTW